MTCDGRPAAIFGWACKMPSKIQITPNPTRSSQRPRGSAHPPPGRGRASTQPREAPHISHSSTNSAAAIRPWCSSADRNAFTIAGSAMFRPEFIPGTAPAPLRSQRGLGVSHAV